MIARCLFVLGFLTVSCSLANGVLAAGCRDAYGAGLVFPDFARNASVRSAAGLAAQLKRGDAIALPASQWGMRENVTIATDPEIGLPVMTVRLPKGSINPRNVTAPLGGMGWRWRPRAFQAGGVGETGRRRDRACLSYGVRFAPGFAFQQGGKLPGLFGGDAPTGGRKADGRTGFSARLMWRRNGAGEVYAYIPGHPDKRGTSIDRGAWVFETGRWIAVAQEIVLNMAGRSNGELRIWIDGELRLDRRDILFRTAADVGISGLIVDIFYGGKTVPWAAPRDTSLKLSAFEIRWMP